MSRDPSRRFSSSRGAPGEGAVLHAAEGTVHAGKHPLAELAPQDIVTRGIIQEMGVPGRPTYLDSAPHRRTAGRFPTIYAEYLRQGIDISAVDRTSVQHYMMGGIHAPDWTR